MKGDTERLRKKDMSAQCDLVFPRENQQEMGHYIALDSLSTFFSNTLGLLLIIHLSHERASTAFSKKVLSHCV